MREMKGELFDQIGNVDWLCITTNGTIKNNGAAVMGRGCALQAKTRWPGLDFFLGAQMKKYGNNPVFLGYVDDLKMWSKELDTVPTRSAFSVLVSFPVKRTWSQPADLVLIEQSARLLVSYTTGNDLDVVIPRPGCGNGGLRWEQVKPVLAPILDDRFVIISNEEE